MTVSHKRVAVILSGCGVYDGSEIHEAVMTLLALDRRNVATQCFAPDKMQHHIIDHLTGDESRESRNVLHEAARIARGAIKPLTSFAAADFDALVLPGGFGAAKNLSDFAFAGASCTVDPGVAAALSAMAAAGKPIGALCIAPALVARVLDGVTVTIGQDPDTAQAIETMGGHHRATESRQIIVDTARKLVTAPCYMLEARVSDIADEADQVVEKLLSLTA